MIGALREAFKLGMIEAIKLVDEETAAAKSLNADTIYRSMDALAQSMRAFVADDEWLDATIKEILWKQKV